MVVPILTKGLGAVSRKGRGAVISLGAFSLAVSLLSGGVGLHGLLLLETTIESAWTLATFLLGLSAASFAWAAILPPKNSSQSESSNNLNSNAYREFEIKVSRDVNEIKVSCRGHNMLPENLDSMAKHLILEMRQGDFDSAPLLPEVKSQENLLPPEGQGYE